jgi:hypothetical protein
VHPAELLDALLSDPAYASGRRSFPRTVTADDAVEITRYAQAEVDKGTQARDAAAARDGVTIACGKGCRRCCSEPVLIYEAEALVVARWLERPENAAAREAFLAAFPRWRDAVGDAPERLSELATTSDQATFDAAHLAQQRTGVLCAFNAPDGSCMIHPARPVACRNGHAIDTPDYCGGDHPSGKAATRLQFVPLDRLVRKHHDLGRALHHALGRPKCKPESLCVAVHRLLTQGVRAGG